MKMALIEAYDTLYSYDIITMSKTMLNSSVNNNEIFIDGFSDAIYLRDHQRNTKMGGVCFYSREGLRVDLELLTEIIITEIKLTRMKVFLGTLNRSPSQNSHQFEDFIDILQQFIGKLKGEYPNYIVLTGGFNCRISISWNGDIDQL